MVSVLASVMKFNGTLCLMCNCVKYRTFKVFREDSNKWDHIKKSAIQISSLWLDHTNGNQTRASIRKRKYNEKYVTKQVIKSVSQNKYHALSYQG